MVHRLCALRLKETFAIGIPKTVYYLILFLSLHSLSIRRVKCPSIHAFGPGVWPGILTV